MTLSACEPGQWLVQAPATEGSLLLLNILVGEDHLVSCSCLPG